LNYAIQVEDLRKVFRGRKRVVALDNISFKIKHNTAVGYLGPNGAGKTTTIKILTNILKPDSGYARIFGYNVQKETIKALERCGAILEVPEFYPYLTPREILTYLGKIRGIKDNTYLKERIKEVLEMVKMINWIDVKIGKFSTGMKQRIAIAQALLHDPELLILDEPTSGLDPKGMAEIRNLINEIKNNRTIFLSSHLLFEVEQIVDTIILINHGKIVVQDKLDKIRSMIRGNQIQIEFLIPLNPQIIKKLESIEEIKDLRLLKENIALIKYDGTPRTRSSILYKLITDYNLKITSYIPVQRKLEDFYVETIDSMEMK